MKTEAETGVMQLHGMPTGARSWSGKGQIVPQRLPRERSPANTLLSDLRPREL